MSKVVSECLASILLNSSNLMRIDLDGANLLAPAVVTALEAGMLFNFARHVMLFLATSSFNRWWSKLFQSCQRGRWSLAKQTSAELTSGGEQANFLVSSSSSQYDPGVQSTCWSPSLHCLFTLPTCQSKIWDQQRGEGWYHIFVPKRFLTMDITCRHQQTNFSQLKPRIVNLLVSALQVQNTSFKFSLFRPDNLKVETETGNAQMLLGCLLLVVQDSAALEVAWVQ